MHDSHSEARDEIVGQVLPPLEVEMFRLDKKTKEPQRYANVWQHDFNSRKGKLCTPVFSIAMYTTLPEYLQMITLYRGSHDMIGIRESRKLLEIDYSVWIGRS